MQLWTRAQDSIPANHIEENRTWLDNQPHYFENKEVKKWVTSQTCCTVSAVLNLSIDLYSLTISRSNLIYIHMLCRLESFSLVDLWYVPLRRIFIG